MLGDVYKNVSTIRSYAKMEKTDVDILPSLFAVSIGGYTGVSYSVEKFCILLNLKEGIYG